MRIPWATVFLPKLKRLKIFIFRLVCSKVRKWKKRRTLWFSLMKFKPIPIFWLCWNFCLRITNSHILQAVHSSALHFHKLHLSRWAALERLECIRLILRNFYMQTVWMNLPFPQCEKSLSILNLSMSQCTIRWWIYFANICLSVGCPTQSMRILKPKI